MNQDEGLEGLGNQVRRGREEIRELGDELSGIAGDFRGLLQSELALARAELREQAKQGVTSLVWAAVAAVATMLMLTFVFVTELLALDTQMSTWMAALTTTATLAAIASLCGAVAFARFRRLRVVPAKTLHSVREDVRWAKDQLSSSSRSTGGATL